MEQLIGRYVERYLPRREILRRLPVSLSINDFWPTLQEARRARAASLPLCDQKGQPFWFVLTPSIERQCDAVAALARRELTFSGAAFDKLFEDAVIDEAVYSSMIEGAFTSREEAAKFIRGYKSPASRSEQMVKNNYDALTYALEHLDAPITEVTIQEIARIVTREAADAAVDGYRLGGVAVSDAEHVVYTPPRADQVPDMMRQLVHFIGQSELHPILKACIAHFYLAYIHPFTDGNGRTARALSFMMLLRAGYDFFRYFSISDIVAKERGKYYRAMLDVEESELDMTYFIDTYSDMLSRAVARMENSLSHHLLAERKVGELSAKGALNERQLKGVRWLLEGDGDRVTVEAWRKKYKTATETARRDLLLLCENGVLERQLEGRKAVFTILR